MHDLPEATAWQFPNPDDAGPEGVVGVGADLEPGTILTAYQSGIFPMPLERDGPLAWWSPDPRGVIPLDGLRVPRSLRKSRRRFRTTINQAFSRVITECADPARPHGWITPDIIDAYKRLHALGWAHSVETWSDRGELAGGLYGIAIGGLFAGESMFHHETDASKVALVRLVDELRRGGSVLLDVQWSTSHLASLGAVEIPRAEYLERLRTAIGRPLPSIFRDDVTG